MAMSAIEAEVLTALESAVGLLRVLNANHEGSPFAASVAVWDGVIQKAELEFESRRVAEPSSGLTPGRPITAEWATANLEDAWSGYEARVKETARLIFEDLVLPFLKKRCFEFLADGASWWLEESGKVSGWRESVKAQLDPEWQQILPILEYTSEGYSEYETQLGAFMPCWPRKNEES